MKAIARRRRERGAALFLAYLIAAFLGAIGLSLLVLTGIGPKISGNLRFHEESFDAAEAGFDAARVVIEDALADGTWTSFAGHYLVQPDGIDRPFLSGAINPGYFRRIPDEILLQEFDAAGDGTPDVSPLLFFHQTFARDESGAVDPRVTYTAFLIDDEAGVGVADPSDALLVVIGAVRAGRRILATTRLEIVISYTPSGTGGS
jgi:hypothetical protein